MTLPADCPPIPHEGSCNSRWGDGTKPCDCARLAVIAYVQGLLDELSDLVHGGPS